jgi:hypothetical protein
MRKPTCYLIIFFALIIWIAGCKPEKQVEKFVVTVASDFEYANITNLLAVSDGYVFTGYKGLSVGPSLCFFGKVGLVGEMQWYYSYQLMNSYHSVTGTSLNAVAHTADGGFLLCGSASSQGTDIMDDIYLVKTNSDGKELWYHILEEPGFTTIGYGIAADPDGGFTVVYSRSSSLAYDGFKQIAIRKVSADGLGSPPVILTSTNSRWPCSMHATSDNGYIISGKSKDATNKTLSYLAKVDLTGNLVWEKYFQPTAEFGFGNGCTQTTAGNYVIAGNVLTPSGKSSFVTRCNGSGNQLWAKTFGSTNYDDASTVVQGNDGKLVVAGVSSTAFVAKLDSNTGQIIWQKFLDNGTGRINVVAAADGGYVLAFVNSHDPYHEKLVVYKLDEDGNYQ